MSNRTSISVRWGHKRLTVAERCLRAHEHTSATDLRRSDTPKQCRHRRRTGEEDIDGTANTQQGPTGEPTDPIYTIANALDSWRPTADSTSPWRRSANTESRPP